MNEVKTVSEMPLRDEYLNGFTARQFREFPTGKRAKVDLWFILNDINPNDVLEIVLEPSHPDMVKITRITKDGVHKFDVYKEDAPD